MSSETIDRAVRASVQRAMEAQPLQLQPDPVAAVRSRMERRRRSRLAAIGVAAAGVAVLGAAALSVSDRGSEDLAAVAPPATRPAVVGEADGVEVLPRPPLEVRGDPAVVWTGSELVVWGGDVEAFNMGVPGPDRTYGDGAAFAPAKRTWRTLSPSPLPSNDTTPVGASTDHGVVIVRGRATALWTPADDTWRPLGDAPAEVSDLTGSGAVAISHSANAVIDPATGRWRALPAAPARLERPTMAWTGRELMVVGDGGPELGAAAVAFNPAVDRWRTLAPPPRQLDPAALSADWDGRRVVVVSYGMGAATYDPVSDTWEPLPPVPGRFAEWHPTVRSAGGLTAAFVASAIAVLSEDRRWTPLPYDGIAFGAIATTRPAARVQEGSGALFIWGLDAERAENVLTAVDLTRFVRAARRVQVGGGSVELPKGFAIVDATYGFLSPGPSVQVVISSTDRGRCTITSGSGWRDLSPPRGVILQNDGRPTGWRRGDDGLTWTTATSSSEEFSIACDKPAVSEEIARSAIFGRA